MSKYKGLFDMSGKVALVAGGTGAIGSEMAAALAAYGARVAIAGRSQERADEVAAGLAALGDLRIINASLQQRNDMDVKNEDQ